VGPTVFPVLWPLAPGKILSRTGRTTIRSPSLSYPQDGRTAPLRTLTKVGRHDETVRILLGRSDVNPDRADKRDRTPLSWAAEYGREESVRMLLERDDVNPEKIESGNLGSM